MTLLVQSFTNQLRATNYAVAPAKAEGHSKLAAKLTEDKAALQVRPKGPGEQQGHPGPAAFKLECSLQSLWKPAPPTPTPSSPPTPTPPPPAPAPLPEDAIHDALSRRRKDVIRRPCALSHCSLPRLQRPVFHTRTAPHSPPSPLSHRSTAARDRWNALRRIPPPSPISAGIGGRVAEGRLGRSGRLHHDAFDRS